MSALVVVVLIYIGTRDEQPDSLRICYSKGCIKVFRDWKLRMNVFTFCLMLRKGTCFLRNGKIKSLQFSLQAFGI